MTYVQLADKVKEIYRQGQKESGIRVGDEVRIKFKARSYEAGWGYPWLNEMDGYVDKVGIVTQIEPHSVMVKVKNRNDVFAFPFFCLEKVNKPTEGTKATEPVPFSQTFEIGNGKSIEVSGCFNLHIKQVD